MKRWENVVALAATVLAAGALLPIRPYPRLICAGAAIVTLVVLCGVRLRAHIARRDAPNSSETYTRIERIRAARGPRRR
jgi:steroid 5-alpha reductase family enzyme